MNRDPSRTRVHVGPLRLPSFRLTTILENPGLRSESTPFSFHVASSTNPYEGSTRKHTCIYLYPSEGHPRGSHALAEFYDRRRNSLCSLFLSYNCSLSSFSVSLPPCRVQPRDLVDGQRRKMLAYDGHTSDTTKSISITSLLICSAD